MSEPVVTPPAADPAAPVVTPAPAAAPQDWTAGFDDAGKAFLKTKGWTEPKHLFDSYRTLESFRGLPEDRLVSLPDKPSDTPEGKAAWNKVYDKLGRPAKPEEYGIATPEGADPTFGAEFAKTFHELGLSKRQVEAITGKWNATVESTTKAQADKIAADYAKMETDLKAKWGNAYQQNVDVAKSVQKFFPQLDEKKYAALEKELGAAQTVEMFYELMSKTGQAKKFETGQQSGFGAVLSPGEAQAAIQSLYKDSDFVNRYMKGDADAVAKIKRLNEQAVSFSQ